MHILANIAKCDQKLHHWERDFLVSTGKVIHNDETMGAIVVLMLMFLGLVLFTIITRISAGPPIPVGPYYY